MTSKILNILPDFIKTKIENRPGLLKIIDNLSWLIFDRIFRMGIGLVVSIWVARYLGPEQFGLLNFGLAFTALFGAIAILGLQEIIVRDLVMYPNDKNEILGTGFILRLIGGIIAFIIVLGIIIIIRPDDTLAKIIVAILGFRLVLGACDVIKYWFESQVQSKYIVWISNGVFLIIAISKLLMILLNSPLMAFVLATFAESFLTAISLVVIYKWKVSGITEWKIKVHRAKRLMRDSWPLILSGIAISISMRIDQIMLGQMAGDKEVGIYSAAVRISEVWYFIPLTIVASVFPSIVEAKKKDKELYYKRLQHLYDILIWLALFVALAMTFLSDFVVKLLFGIQYFEAGDILKIHIWAGISVAIGIAWSKWIVIENKQKLAIFGNALGAILNLILNFFLIKTHGSKGAAIATLLSYVISGFIIYLFYKPKIAYGMIVNSFNLKRVNFNGIRK